MSPSEAPSCEIDTDEFNICLGFSDAITEEQRELFIDAAAEWEQIITADENSVNWNILGNSADFNAFCSVALGAFGHTIDDDANARQTAVDDVAICVNSDSIDGEGRVIGSGGAILSRMALFEKPTTVVGFMRFDAADLASNNPDVIKVINSTILHEMGHVLGIGNSWEEAGLIPSPRVPETCNDYRGANANREYQQLSGCADSSIPIENDFGSDSTDCGHFDETCFGNGKLNIVSLRDKLFWVTIFLPFRI